MNYEELNQLLEERDRIVANSDEFEGINSLVIESEEIRELGRIVLEISSEDCAVFSST